MKNRNNLFWGALFILLGVAVLLEKFSFWSFININFWDFIWKLWPLIIVSIGINRILYKDVTSGIIISIIGLLFLINSLFDINTLAYFWPILLIGIGIYIMTKKDDNVVIPSNVSTKDRFTDTVVFWGDEKRLTSDNFVGGKIDVFFGGYDLDLSDVKIAKGGAKLEVNTLFGGADIIVPKNCRVVTNGSGIFGGWDAKLASRDVKEPVLEITGTAFFGGVDIKE